MGVHVEWMEARRSSAVAYLPGDETPDGEVIDDRDGIGVAIDGDSVTVITGEPGAIRTLAMKMIRASILAEVELDKRRVKQAKELKKKVEAAL